jgi:hypothetical protein
MIRSITVSVILPLLVFSLPLLGQESLENGFDHDKWMSVMNRWIRAQPAVVLKSDSGTQYYGQPIHASADTLYLYASTGFPVGPDWLNELDAIPLNIINEVLMQKGGNRVTRSHRAVSLVVPSTNRLQDPAFNFVRRGSVYSDSLVSPNELGDAFPHSKVLRQAFPDKHFRLSIGLGFGGNRATGDAEEALGSSPLPNPYEGYGRSATLDFLDLSWRFHDRFIVGGELFSRRLNSNIYGDNYGVEQSMSYNYALSFMEQRIYAEYAIFHVDRYFTRRTEVLAGAGLLMGEPMVSMSYYYSDYSDPDNIFYGDITYTQEDNLFGFQLSGTYHIYFFPGLSLWTGLEVNLYKPWIVEAVEFPTSDPDVPMLLQEHSLSLSGMRLKFGVSIYL